MAKLLAVDTRDLQRVSRSLGDAGRDVQRDWARQVSSRGSSILRSNVTRNTRTPWHRSFYGRPSVRVGGSGTGSATIGVTALSGGLGSGPPYGWELVEHGSRRGYDGRLPRHRGEGWVWMPALRGFSAWLSKMATKIAADTLRDATGGE